MKHLIILVTLFLSFCSSPAQNSKIKLQIKGAENQKVQFAYYFQDDINMLKEITLDKKGKGTFEFEEKLQRGIYLIIIPEVTYFDVLISNEQNFELKTNISDPILNMKVKNSQDNKVFYRHQLGATKLIQQQKEIEDKIAQTKDDAEIEKLEAEKEEIGKKMDEYWRNEIEKNESPFFSKILKAMHVFEVPYNQLYEYVDFSEQGLVRTPFFHTILKYHVAHNIEKNPQEIIKLNDELIEKTKSDTIIYQYVTYFFLTYYKDICKFGVNEVFVNLSDKYFLNGNADWIAPEGIDLIKRTTDNYRYSLVGSNAYDFKALSTTGDSLALSDIDAEYKLLFFWSIGCGHCEEAADSLRNNYPKLQEAGYEVIAFNTDSKTKDRWQDYIKNRNYQWTNLIDLKQNYPTRQNYFVCSSPLMYVLNSEDKILAKLYGQEQITNFVERVKKE